MTKSEAVAKGLQRGWTAKRIAERVGCDLSLVYSVRGGKKGSKVVQSSSVASTAPQGLNGLTRCWNQAEKLVARAKRIKAAVKELNKALHSR